MQHLVGDGCQRPAVAVEPAIGGMEHEIMSLQQFVGRAVGLVEEGHRHEGTIDFGAAHSACIVRRRLQYAFHLIAGSQIEFARRIKCCQIVIDCFHRSGAQARQIRSRAGKKCLRIRIVEESEQQMFERDIAVGALLGSRNRPPYRMSEIGRLWSVGRKSRNFGHLLPRNASPFAPCPPALNIANHPAEEAVCAFAHPHQPVYPRRRNRYNSEAT